MLSEGNDYERFRMPMTQFWVRVATTGSASPGHAGHVRSNLAYVCDPGVFGVRHIAAYGTTGPADERAKVPGLLTYRHRPSAALAVVSVVIDQGRA